MAKRMTSGRRARLMIGTLLVLIGSLVALTGCSVAPHLSAKLDHGTLSFVSCDDYSANRILLEAAALKGKYLDYKTIWEATGSGKFGPNAPVVLGTPPAGFHTTSGPRAFIFRKVKISFAFFRNSRPGALGTAEDSQFDGSKLVDGRWLRWDGSVADSPC